MDREVGYFEGALGFCSRGSTDWPFERDRLFGQRNPVFLAVAATRSFLLLAGLFTLDTVDGFLIIGAVSLAREEFVSPGALHDKRRFLCRTAR